MKTKIKCLSRQYLIPVLAIFVTCCFIQCDSKNKSKPNQVTEKSAKTQQLMQKWADEINRSCPMAVDPISRLDSVNVQSENLFQYYYTVTDRSQFDINQWKTMGEKQIKYMYKTDPKMEDFRVHSISVKYQYADTTGVEFYSFTVTPQDYQ